MVIFLIASFSILIGIAIFMPKNMTKIELYISYFFMLILSWSINVVIDSKYDLRSFFQKGPDYPSMLMFMIVFPCFNVIILNFYPFKQGSIIKKTAYVLFCILILLAYEVLLVKFNILHYYKWKYVYSIFLYIVDILSMLLNIKIVNYLIGKDIKMKY